MQVGIIPVSAQNNLWTLSANAANYREINGSRDALAKALGLNPEDLLWNANGMRPLWVNSGSDQLMVPLVSANAVAGAMPSSAAPAVLRSTQGRHMAYIFAQTDNELVSSRFFFEADGAMREDPATGSACANLGGWYVATGATLPLRRRIQQGDAVRRPSTLLLSIDAAAHTRVAGEVVHLGTGSVEL